MAYITKQSLSTDKTITIGGVNRETGVKNPTSIEGYFIGTKTTPDKGFGPGKLHIFQTKDGNVGVWGKSYLNSLLTAEMAGLMCLVEFQGMSKPKKGRNPAYTYGLKYDPDNRIEVSGFNLEDAGEEQSDDETPVAAEEYHTSADEEEALDEVVAHRAVAPKRPAVATSAENARRVQELLAGRKSKSA